MLVLAILSVIFEPVLNSRAVVVLIIATFFCGTTRRRVALSKD